MIRPPAISQMQHLEAPYANTHKGYSFQSPFAGDKYLEADCFLVKKTRKQSV